MSFHDRDDEAPDPRMVVAFRIIIAVVIILIALSIFA